MKTTNNVQKTVLRSAAVVVSFVLISFTVAAQDFWKTILTNSSFNQIALAMVETSKTTETSSSTANSANFILEKDNDAELLVEDWMTNNSFFNQIAVQQEAESDLQLEDWMLNESLFMVAEVEETPLRLENWMTSSEVWKN